MNTPTESLSQNEIVHIGLDFPDDAPDFFIGKAVEDLETPRLSIKIHKHETSVMYAALEWIIPTAIAAYILKPYFDGFLKEAGKDHYQILKTWLKKFTDNARVIKIHTIYSSQATQKRNIDNTQSKAISLLIQTQNGKLIKLLFDETLTKDDWDNAIDQLLDCVIENYEKSPNDRLTTALSELESRKKSPIYAIIDRDGKQLLFFDDNKLMQLHRQQISRQEKEADKK